MLKRKILIVDDEIENLKYIEFVLNSKGYKVLTAGDGQECLEILKKEDVDVVLLDIVMPKMTGLEALEEIRKDDNLKTIPVLLISSLSDKENRLKGLSLGADDFISKPFDRDELITKVETQIRLQYERRKLSEKEKLLEVVEKIEEGIVITDKYYRVLYMNKIAKNIFQIEMCRDIENFIEYLKKRYSVLFEENSKKFILNILRERKLYFNCIIQEVKNIEEEIDSYIFIFRNITEEFLESALKLDFLSLITHKVFTPFTSLSGNIQLLKKKLTGDNSLKEMILKIEEDKERMFELLNRMLYFVEFQKENLKKNVNKEEFLLFVREKFKERKINLKTDIEDNFEMYKFIVIKELIDNAIKFSDGEIDVFVKMKGNEVIVSDNGIGIPDGEKDKIFESFYQIDRDKTGQIPGIGLGLSIVRKISELFNGKILIETNLPRGTVFKVIFNI